MRGKPRKWFPYSMCDGQSHPLCANTTILSLRTAATLQGKNGPGVRKAIISEVKVLPRERRCKPGSLV